METIDDEELLTRKVIEKLSYVGHRHFGGIKFCTEVINLRKILSLTYFELFKCMTYLNLTLCKCM